MESSAWYNTVHACVKFLSNLLTTQLHIPTERPRCRGICALYDVHTYI